MEPFETSQTYIPGAKLRLIMRLEEYGNTTSVLDTKKVKPPQIRKGVLDAKRGKVFSKLDKEIAVACKHGGGDPGFNPRLRTIIESSLGPGMILHTVGAAIMEPGPGAIGPHVDYVAVPEPFDEPDANGAVRQSAQ